MPSSLSLVDTRIPDGPPSLSEEERIETPISAWSAEGVSSSWTRSPSTTPLLTASSTASPPPESSSAVAKQLDPDTQGHDSSYDEPKSVNGDSSAEEIMNKPKL
ncbi:hypothetical protein B7494_g8233 [Chlorociboria aeruginascens]|nr:hypothetical protein B7494_g8233 [Chlorociboria aeruginascens]